MTYQNPKLELKTWLAELTKDFSITDDKFYATYILKDFRCECTDAIGSESLIILQLKWLNQSHSLCAKFQNSIKKIKSHALIYSDKKSSVSSKGYHPPRQPKGKFSKSVKSWQIFSSNA